MNMDDTCAALKEEPATGEECEHQETEIRKQILEGALALVPADVQFLYQDAVNRIGSRFLTVLRYEEQYFVTTAE